MADAIRENIPVETPPYVLHLTLSQHEAEILRRLLYSHVAGCGNTRKTLDGIHLALSQAGVSPADRFNASAGYESVIIDD